MIRNAQSKSDHQIERENVFYVSDDYGPIPILAVVSWEISRVAWIYLDQKIGLHCPIIAVGEAEEVEVEN